MPFYHATVGFKVNGKPVKFNVIHNLPSDDSVVDSLNSAVQNWLARTDDYTARSFCDYVNSKNTGYVAMTEKQFKRLQKRKT